MNFEFKQNEKYFDMYIDDKKAAEKITQQELYILSQKSMFAFNLCGALMVKKTLKKAGI